MDTIDGRDGQHRGPALHARTSTEQLRLLLGLSETLAGTRTVSEVATSIIDIAQHHLGAMFGGVAVVDDDNRALTFVTLDPLPPSLQATRQFVPLSSPRPAAVAARQRRPLLFETLADAEQQMDAESAVAARESGGHSFAYLPMLLGGSVIGTVVLIWPEETSFHADDQQLLWALARYSAQAIDRARLLAQRREVAHTLQAALLPVLPEVAWLEMYGHYRPADLADMVGGDWYDAFISEPGEAGRPESLTVTVGDVAGHDTHAAAEMGRLVAKLRALAIDQPDRPDRLLRRLERVMNANIHNRHASALVATLTPDEDAGVCMAWSNAGHPPPLVLVPGAEPAFLRETANLLLGISYPAPERDAHLLTLPPGSTVLLYTDGLIERRDEDLSDSLVRLARLADVHRELALPELVASVIAGTATDAQQHDDTVLFALRTRPPAG
jgi:serine phosphatase RsbU (regulator of sigma subunit)